MNSFCRPVIGHIVEISRIHTTLEILLLLQTKVTKFAITRYFFWTVVPQKCAGGRGFALDPAGGAYSAPAGLLAGF